MAQDAEAGTALNEREATVAEELSALEAFAQVLCQMRPHARIASLRWLAAKFHVRLIRRGIQDG